MKDKFYGNTWYVSRIVLVTGFLMSLLSFQASAVIPVTVTNNTLALPANQVASSYPDLASALTALNGVNGFTGPGTITFTLTGGSETAPSTTGFTIGNTALNLALLGGANPIVFNTSAASTLNAATGGTGLPNSAIQDGILKIVGADYITLDGIAFVDGNTANPATMEYGIGLFKNSATDGSTNNTIKNCTITLSAANNATSTAPAIEGSRGINIMNSLPTTQTTAVTVTSSNGTNSNNKIYSNIIQNCNYGIAITGFAATGGGPSPNPLTFLGDLNNDIGGLTALNGNTIKNYGGGGTNAAAAIRVQNQWGINISYNTVISNDGSPGVVNHAATLRGIYAQSGTSANATISYNVITTSCAAASSASAAIENAIGSTAASNTVTIDHNTVYNCTYTSATTASFSGILSSATAANVIITNNSVTGNTLGTSGTGSSCTFYGIYSSGTATNLTISNNNVSNNQVLNSFGDMYCLRGSTSIITADNNTVDNNGFPNSAGSTSSSLYGYYDGSSPTQENITNNTISNLYIDGSSTATAHIIYGVYTVTISTDVISYAGNYVHSLRFSSSGTGACNVNGLRNSSGGTVTYSKNKICNLSSTGGTSTVVAGIMITSGVNVTATNNIIGDLRNPSSGNTNGIIGLNETSTTAANSYTFNYNTVYLNASSSATNFGSSAISVNTGPTVNMNNNLLVNNSTSNGTGLTVAYRRSSATIGTYGANSDRNIFFAPNIYTDGTNTFTVLGPGAGSYKNFVSPKDANSLSENPPFLSTTCGDANFLHINTTIATAVESNAANITGITIDYDGQTRQGNAGYSGTGTAPDIGADEFNGIPIPACSGNPSVPTISGAGAVCTGTGTTLNLNGLDQATGLTIQWSSGTIAGGPYPTTLGTGTSQLTGAINSTTYYMVTVTCTNSGGTSSAVEKQVVVNPLPSVSINPSSATFCLGQSGVSLTANNASTYTWSPSTRLSATTGSVVVATPLVNTTYTVTGTDANGCVATSTSVITSSSSGIVNSVVSTPANVCNGNSATLTASGFSTATVANYQFTASSTPGAFVPISGGTPVSTTTSVADFLGDTKTSVPLPLGFNFVYEGITYTSLKAMANGFVSFNPAAIDITANNLTSSSAASRPLIAPLWDDLDGASGSGSASYITTGSPGTRVFTVEWINWQWNWQSTGAQISFQLKLYEGENKIQFIYRQEADALNAPTASIGLGGHGTGVGNFLSLDGTTPSPSTSSTTETTGIAAKPATDQVYTFTPPPPSYAWSPSTFLSSTTGTVVTATNMTTTTTYTVTASVPGGCTSTQTVTVGVGLALNCGALTASSSSCFGLRTVTAHPSAGGDPYTYAWTEDGTAIAPTTQTITANVGTHTYNCLVTDNCGQSCNSGNLIVTTNALPVVSVNPPSGLICKPSGTAVTLNATGASSYTWSPTGGLDVTTGNVVVSNPASSTSYTVTGTNANGCVSSTNVTVAVSVTPYFTASPSSIDICSGSSTNISVSDVYSNAFTYSTTITVPAAGSTSGTSDPYPSSLTISGVPVGAVLKSVKLNTVTHTDMTDFDILLQSPTGTNVIILSDEFTGADVITPIDLTFLDGATPITTSTVPATGVYALSNSGTTDAFATPGPGSITQATPLLSGFGNGNMNGTWNLYVVDDASGDIGAIGSWSLTFELLPFSSVTYSWSPTSGLNPTSGAFVTAQPASSTIYTVTGTNVEGCTATATSEINVGSQMICGALTVNNANCAGSDFTVTAHPDGGGIPYSYAWNDGSTTVYPNAASITSNLPAGSYAFTCVVTDNCGSTCSSSVAITIHALPTVTVNPNSSLICIPGGSAVTLNANGATNYSWSPSAGASATTGSSIGAFPATNTQYTVTGTDANGCFNSATASITLGSTPILIVDPSSVDICNGASTNLSVSSSFNGTFPYTTTITIPTAGTTVGVSSPYPATLPVSGVPLGSVLKEVHFDNYTQTNFPDVDILLQSPSGINVVIMSDAFNTVDGAGINLVLKDGSPLMTTTTPPASGTYAPTNNATTADPFAAPGPGSMPASTPALTDFGSGNMNGTWNLFVVDDASGDIGSIGSWSLVFEIANDPSTTYTWSPASGLNVTTGTNVTATPASTTVYTITGTNSSGCSGTTTSTVTVGAQLVCSPATFTGILCAGNDFTVTAHVSGGGQPYTYSWSDGSTTVYPNSDEITANKSAGSYTFTCTVTDACGSSCQSSVSVNVNALPNISVSPSSGQICYPGGSAVTFTASGANSYTISPLTNVTQLSANSAAAFPPVSTVYTVYGLDANGCSNSTPVNIQVGSTISNINPVATPADVCPGTFSQLSAGGVLDNPVSPATYSFSASSGTFNALVGGIPVSTTTSVADFLGDTKTSVVIPLGFTFNYLGAAYTSVKAMSDGYISFNPAATSTLTNNPSTTAATNRPMIAPLWDDLDGASGTGSANYLTEGTPGSQVFTMEWLDWQWNYSATGAVISFQVKLYEADGRIEFIYEDEAGTINSPSGSIGLVGNGTGAGSYYVLEGAGASPTVSATSNYTAINAKPATGQVYTFLPPSEYITYSWQPAAGLKPNANVQNPETPALLGTTVYTVTATNNGCNSTATVTVHVDPLVASPATKSAITCAGNNFNVTAHHTGGGAPYSYAWSDGVGGVYPNAATITANLPSGTYSFDATITDNCGNVVTSSVNVTVNESPIISVSQTSAQICNPGGSQVTLTANGGLSYTWSPSAGLTTTTGTTVSAFPLVNTVYTAVGTSSNGCTSSGVSASIQVGYTPQNVSASSTPATLCPGGTAQLNAQALCSTPILITEYQLYNILGSGRTDPYPSYIQASMADEFVEISNISTVPYDVSGFKFQLWEDATLSTDYTIPNGAVIPPLSVLVLALKTGTDDPANLLYFTSVFENILSSANHGLVLKQGSTVIDAVALNNHTWSAASGVTAADWSGCCLAPPSTAGIEREAAVDHNTVSDWVVNSSTNVQTIGFYNDVYNVQSCSPSISWNPAAGLTPGPDVTNPVTPVLNSTTVYTVTFTTNGCSTSTTATVNVVVTDDNNACTNDFCNTTTNTAFHTPVNVDDGDPCTTDACDSNTGNITHTPSCGVTLNSSIFIQGYYSGGGLMETAGAGTLFIDGVPGAVATDADTVSISAMEPTSPYTLVQEQKGILHTNGTISVTFTSPVTAGNSYYLRVLHRNSVETWSAAPVTLSPVGSYLFSSAATQAFAANQADLGDGNFAIYSGDINHDGAVDGSDFLELDPSIQNGDGGYAPGDLNGDGAVDGSDFLVLDPNIQNGIGAALP